MKVICFLTVTPSKLFYEYVKKFRRPDYNVFIIIDNDNYNIPDYDGYIPIVKINSNECENNGFKNTVFQVGNHACSRDKALYYFCRKYTNYDQIWLIEEDVFVPTIDTLFEIDKKYDGDLLSPSNIIKNDNIINDKEWYCWRYVLKQIKMKPPYACSMICAIRVSRNLMRLIDRYALKFKCLFLDEALFNTLCLKGNLKNINPVELSTVVYNNEWKLEDIKATNLYHPIKNINTQYEYRERMLNDK